MDLAALCGPLHETDDLDVADLRYVDGFTGAIRIVCCSDPDPDLKCSSLDKLGKMKTKNV